MKRSADWLAWSLQFVVGLAVGAFIGVAIISRRRRFGSGWWLAPEQASFFICGAALLGAGLASFYGDRLWLGSSFRVIPPKDIEHSKASRIVSIVTVFAGSITLASVILRHFVAV